MERIELSTNLFLDEYIPKAEYMEFKDSPGVLIRKLNPALIRADQLMRDVFGPVEINNWWDDGEKEFSGWRPSGCKTGAALSDHHEGNASDKTFKNATPEEVREWLKNGNWQRLHITVIEEFEGMDWVHTSVAWVKDQTQLWIVKPNT
jgi:hypothetical protein